MNVPFLGMMKPDCILLSPLGEMIFEDDSVVGLITTFSRILTCPNKIIGSVKESAKMMTINLFVSAGVTLRLCAMMMFLRLLLLYEMNLCLAKMQHFVVNVKRFYKKIF